jgi:hypothetical protein
MAATDLVGVIDTASQSSSRKHPPDLRLLHYNDVYHIEYVAPAVYWPVGSLTLLSGLAQRSQSAASLASGRLSTNIDMTLVMWTSLLFSHYSLATRLTPALKALSQRADIWFRF